MRFEAAIQRLFLVLAIGFAAVLAATVYWAVFGPETILRGQFNYRLRDEAARIVRGSIVDRHGDILIASRAADDGTVTRTQLTPDLFALIGYFSLQYGTSGAESAFDTLLTGASLYDRLEAEFRYNLLHYKRTGIDIQLTVDDRLQKAAAAALGNSPGGAVIMDPSTGDILALVSQPSVDPMTLDRDWADLIQSPDNPFVNRAVQGAYPSAVAGRIAALAAWLLDGRSREDQVERAAVSCGRGDSPLLSVADAFAEGCLGLGDWIAAQVGPSRIEEIEILFGLNDRTSLPGFDAAPIRTANGDNSEVQNVGRLRSPLDLAMVMATLENDGNMPAPTLLLGTRAPSEAEFTAAAVDTSSRAVLTSGMARAISGVLRRTAATALERANPPCTLDQPAMYTSVDAQGDSIVTSVIGSVFTESGQIRVISLIVEEHPDLSQDDLINRVATLLCEVQDATDGD